MASLRIAVIGAGVIGRTHIDTLARVDGMELAAIVEPAPAGRTLAGERGVPCHADVAALIAAGGIDGAVVAAPNELHLPVTGALLEAGIPVLLEKPVAESVASAAALIAAQARTGTPVLVGHHRRHNAKVKAAKTAIESGAIGGLAVATVTCTLMKPASYFDAAWRRTPGVGGPILINLIHEVDLLRHFFGEIASVQALSGNRIRGLPVEDTAAVLLTFERGGVATLAISDAAAGPWSWDMASGENTARFPAYDVSTHLYGGSLGGLSLPDLKVWRHDGALDWTVRMNATVPAFAWQDPYVAQLAHFGAVIRGAAPLIGIADGSANIVVCDAIREAARTGGARPVDLAALGARAPGQTPR